MFESLATSLGGNGFTAANPASLPGLHPFIKYLLQGGNPANFAQWMAAQPKGMAGANPAQTAAATPQGGVAPALGAPVKQPWEVQGPPPGQMWNPLLNRNVFKGGAEDNTVVRGVAPGAPAPTTPSWNMKQNLGSGLDQENWSQRAF